MRSKGGEVLETSTSKKTAPQDLQGSLQRALPKQPLGGAISLLLLYFWLEYYRPVNPLALPLVISLALFIWWASLKEKIWTPHVLALYGLLAVIAVMGPFAVNNYSIWVGFQAMFAVIACISIPIMHFANSLRKIKVLVNALIFLHCYIAGYAILHHGYGPGGSVGDENDVALALVTIIPIAFCLSLATTTIKGRVFYLLATGLMAAGVVASNSRGGFLGLVAVMGYCFVYSPRKGLSLVLGALLCVVGFFAIPETYWEEMATISRDAESDVGTGAHRKKLWGIAMSMFEANPIFGVGLNNFSWNAGPYMSEELLEKEGRSYSGQVAHSMYFTILAETGIAGSVCIIAIVTFLIKSLRNILKQVRKADKSDELDGEVRSVLPEINALTRGFRGGMLGYGVSGIFLTALVYPHFWYLVGLVVAVEKVTESLLRNEVCSAS